MSTPAPENQGENAPYAEETAITRLLGDHPKVKLLSVLSSEGRDINVSQLAEQSGMSRSTVYDHLEELQELDVVEHTRKIGGSPLYQLNKNSEVAKKFAQLEWALLDVVAE